MKKHVLAMAVAASTMALSGMAQAEVKIGFLGGFTGGIESLTPPIFDGAQLAVTQINEQGGLLGGQMIDMPTGDTTCSDASAASNAADRMVNTEQVTAIVGALCTGATIAAANNAAIPGGVVMVSPASTAPAVSELDDNDLVFRTVPSDAFQGEMLARLLLDKGIDEVVVTYVNNDYGQGLSDAFTATFEAEGGMVAENLAPRLTDVPLQDERDTDLYNRASGLTLGVLFVGGLSIIPVIYVLEAAGRIETPPEVNGAIFLASGLFLMWGVSYGIVKRR